MKSTFRTNLPWWIFAVITLVLAIWSSWRMIDLYAADELWGYLPLALCLGLYFFFSFTFFALKRRDAQQKRLYLTASLAGLMMGLSFPPLPFLLLVIPAWMLVFHLSETHFKEVGQSLFAQFRIYFHIFIIWNIVSTYWICNTALAAGFIAIVVNALLMATVFIIYTILKKRIQTKYWFILLASIWMSFEFLHFRWDIQWPWLTLGHYFMEQIDYIQWYEWTGVYGGTLLILLVSWVAYRNIEMWRAQGRLNKPSLFFLLALIVLPAICSLLIKPAEESCSNEVKIGIIQPNYEPHYEKFEVSATKQMAQFIKLSRSIVDSSVDYLIFPETSFDVSLNSWNTHFVPQTLNNFLNVHKQLTLIAGLDTYRVLENGDKHDEFTRTHIRKNGDTVYWENHNSAVRMAAGMPMEIYYKSKLVPGAEYFPFKDLLFFLKPLMKKLGGTANGLRNQKERETFLGKDEYRSAPIICYESIFGEYVSGYVRNDADWFVIMTNDGWWDNTAGHIQHLNLARLRAIEQRRDIARSANTGISCLIKKDGSVEDMTQYGVADAIIVNVCPGKEISFYNRYGDYIARLGILFFLGALIFYLSKTLKKRKTLS